MAPQSRCPDCGTMTGAAVGEPTGQHQAPGSNAACPGVGEPGVEITPPDEE
jgi:hypothetical protein